MSNDKLTTKALFRTIGNTERARSAKADSVFRQLRKDIKQAEKPHTTFRRATDVSARLKLASRQSV